MKGISDRTAELACAWLTRAGVVFSFLAGCCSLLALWLDKDVSSRKKAEDDRAEIARQKEVQLARTTAEEATRRASELEKRARPRELKPDQRTRLLALLREAPKGTVFVLPKRFDEEAERFAGDISQTLQEAGFEVKPWGGQNPMSFGIPGEFIFLRDMHNPPSHAVSIQNAFRQVGITLAAYPDDGSCTEAGAVTVAISRKN